MEKALYAFMINICQATAIWLALMGVGAVVLLLVTRRGPESGSARPPRRSRRWRRSRVDPEARRYAEEVAVAAERAAVTAVRRRDAWLAEQRAVELTRAACDAAGAAARRAGAAAAFPAPRTPRTPVEYAERERHLHRTAAAAYWRGELSASTLVDALAHRGDWDPRLHPVELEVVLRRAAHADLLASERAATGRERSAWRDAELAAAAARSLRAEAYAAAGRVRQPLFRTVPSTVAPAAPSTVAPDRLSPATVGLPVIGRTPAAAGAQPAGGAGWPPGGQRAAARWRAARAG